MYSLPQLRQVFCSCSKVFDLRERYFLSRHFSLSRSSESSRTFLSSLSRSRRTVDCSSSEATKAAGAFEMNLEIFGRVGMLVREIVLVMKECD